MYQTIVHYLKVKLKPQEKRTLWRLNAELLNSKLTVKEIKTEIKVYQNENDSGKVSPVILWDALKAVMKGKVIVKSAAIRRKRRNS